MSRSGRWAPASALALAAAAVTAYQLSRPGLLFGMTADISVYFGSAVRLVHGIVPYRDFVLVQPPGLILLGTPFAGLSEAIGTRDGLAALRLCTPLLSAGTVLAAARAVRHLGPAPVIAAGAVVALFPAELYALSSVLLEPVVNLLCLLGAVLAFEAGDWSPSARRVGAAGVLFGLACAVKLTAAVPLAALVVVALPAARRLLPRITLGAAAGFVLPCVAFFALAPGSFWRDIVAAQVGRTGGLGHSVLLATAALALAGLTLLVRVSPLARLALLATGWTALAAVAPREAYPQYPALIAPWAALLAAVAIAQLGSRTRAAAVAVAAIGAGVLLISQLYTIQRLSAPDAARTVDAVIPAGACVISDKPRLLLTTDRFQSGRGSCTSMTDPFGTSLALGARSAAGIAAWRSMVESADYIVSDEPISAWYIEPTPDLLQEVAARFRAERSGGLWFYVLR